MFFCCGFHALHRIITICIVSPPEQPLHSGSMVQKSSGCRRRRRDNKEGSPSLPLVAAESWSGCEPPPPVVAHFLQVILLPRQQMTRNEHQSVDRVTGGVRGRGGSVSGSSARGAN